MRKPVRIGIGGPVGSGKTALLVSLCRNMGEHHSLAAITNDIYTKEDAEFVVKSGAIAPERVAGVETGGCPHTAIREDVSMNAHAIEEMAALLPDLDIVFVESGGDNLARDLQPRAGGQLHLRHRRGRGRQDPAQGRARYHQVAAARHQQDRSRADGGRRPRRDGAGFEERCGASGPSFSPTCARATGSPT